MDGGGRCQQRQSGTDTSCSCLFCIEDRSGAEIFAPSSSSGLNGDAAATSRMASNNNVTVDLPRKEVTTPLDRSSMPAQSSNRQLQSGLFFGGSKPSSAQCRSLVSLCVGVLGEHLEDLIEDMHVIAPAFPSHVKGKLLAIARRRGLLCDELLVALADNSWEILDVSGSDVTDSSLIAVACACPRLLDLDISRCSRLTHAAVCALVEHCPSLRTLRCGGTGLSDAIARRSISYILPRLNHNEEAEESWEILDTKPVGEGAQSLRWLVWPGIDNKSREILTTECPRISINPIFSWRTYGIVPRGAQPGVVLDSLILEDVDPKAWAVVSSTRFQKTGSSSTDDTTDDGMSVAERFRLAFISRDERLAPKRAKNMRQNQRRAEKAWLSANPDVKANVWAGIAWKSLKNSTL